MAEDQGNRFERKRAPNGMTLARMEQIEELVKAGREGEVSADEMAQYKDMQARWTETFEPVRRQWANSQRLVQSQVAAATSVPDVAKSLARTLGKINGTVPQVDTSSADSLRLRPPPPAVQVPSPSFDALNESAAAAAEEREARERKAQETADYSAQLLEDLINILTEVEVSNRATAETLHELRAAREESERSNSRQFWINVGLTVLVAVASILVPWWLAT